MRYRIAIDAMGGDNAPREIVRGAVDALKNNPCDIVLVGHEDRIRNELSSLSYNPGRVRIVHTDTTVDMSDPATEVLKKNKGGASLPLTARVVADGDADAMISAGNTGAAMVSARKHLGLLENIERPAIATLIPSLTGKTVLLDSGANVDCKPRHLLDFAVMGSLYAETVLHIKNPRIGMLSVGEEKNKGNDLIKKTYHLLEEAPLNFTGNVEGRDISNGTVDVVVCDGFIGNIIIKFGEGIVSFLRKNARQNLKKHWWRLPAAFCLRKTYLEIKKDCDYAETGGAPLLGLKDICIICHGGSYSNAISNAVGVSIKMLSKNIIKKFIDKSNYSSRDVREKA